MVSWSKDPNLYPPYWRSRIRRGQGVGEGIDYRAWLRVADVPSRGTSGVIKGILIPRRYYVLSTPEQIYFFQIERRKTTRDICEGWPILDLDRTLELCAKHQVRLGYRRGFPEPMTVDFKVTECIEGVLLERAVGVKTKEASEDPETRRKLLPQFEWCEEAGMPWTLAASPLFNKTVHTNLVYIRAWHQARWQRDEDKACRFAEAFNTNYKSNVLLKELIDTTASRLRMPISIATVLFRYCAWADLIPVSLLKRIALDRPLVLRRRSEGLEL